MAYIGYARVSSTGQNIARQVEELKKIGCEIIYQDSQSGKDFNRVGYAKMKQKIRKNDVLFVHDLFRFGRNAKEIRKEWEAIREEGADIVVVNMPMLDTRRKENDIGVGELISDIVLTLLAWMAEDERNRIRSAQREGIEIAKRQGKYQGRKMKYHPDAKGKAKLIYDEVVKKLNLGVSVMDIHRETDLSRDTIYRIKRNMKKLKEEKGE
ncbi:recombinase family protein [Shouchella miscanthi]|uniref:Recombinase family protein n=1 Tax=Shouchella miscanthi TaxID=2598861 RepID=A0ABU6NNE6_9BACI|nr:recombinase family protein [Shouchella miscanthi]